jgi:hypothetical protein
MLRLYIPYLFLFLLISCNNKSESTIDIQSAYLDKRIKEVSTLLDLDVESSGNRVEGVRYQYKVEQLNNIRDSIYNSLEKEDLDQAKSLTKEYLGIVMNNLPNGVKLNNELITESLATLSSNNHNTFRNSLKLFQIEVIEFYRNQFENIFYKYDDVFPFILPDTECPKKGMPYQAQVLMLGVKGTERICEVDFLDDDQGFIKLPVSQSLGGKLIISNLKKDTTKMIIRITEIHHNQKMTFENEVYVVAE